MTDTDAAVGGEDRTVTGSGVDAAPVSIGGVLEVLAEEFPDVTISKIRFLESQGLVQPERNTSGYRQFADADIERLRWILRQQRDHFLPLKVIRRALERGVDVIDAGAGDQPTLWTAVAEAAAQEEINDERDRIARSEAADARKDAVRSQTHPSTRKRQPESVSGDVRGGTAGGRRRRHSSPADVVAALQEDPRGPVAPAAKGAQEAASGPTEEPPGDPVDASKETPGPTVAPERADAVTADETASDGQVRRLGREELLFEANVSEELLDELVEYGLVDPDAVAGEPVYDHVDLAIALLAGRSAALGISPRHLRMYKVAAVREAGLLEQVAMPLLKQRNPAAKAKATQTVAELARMGVELHELLLGRELGPHLAP